MEEIKEADLAQMSPKEFRAIVRQEKWTGPTMKACRGFVQANLVIVPQNIAFDFLLFCTRNPKPCPILEVGEPGDPYSRLVAPGTDIRTDLPRYRVFEYGRLIAEPTDIKEYWKDDYVLFLLGCSLSFDWLLQAAGIQYRFLGAYNTNIQCVPAGKFAGHLVVSCRLVNAGQDAIHAVQISTRYPAVHGGPVYMGNPGAIGIKNLLISDYHPKYPALPLIEPMKPDEVALFWGCGITPQRVATEVKLPLLIAHSSGSMFITDWLSTELINMDLRTYKLE